MTHHKFHIVATACLIAVASQAFAQSVPYEQSHTIGSLLNQGSTRLIYPARLHREVEVSRSLAAQPVHPHMAKVIIGGGSDHLSSGRAGGALSTYIDPLRQLTGDGGLDDDHSLVKAQRLHRSLSGITTDQLAALSNASLKTQPRAVGSNRARLILPPQSHGLMPNDRPTLKPVFILPNPKPGKNNAQPIPSPKRVPAKGESLAANTN